jgi:hypothetical protein
LNSETNPFRESKNPVAEEQKIMKIQSSSSLGLFLGFLLLSLTPSSMAKFVVEKNSLRVTSPDSIKGTYDSAIGNFGIPQYGGSMAGNVVFPKENQKGCKEFADSGISFKSKPGALPTIVLLDRGSMILKPSFFFCIVLILG